MVKVSVIVPIYNVEHYLKKCFDSLQKQILNEIEVLAVNDGSPDHSQEIIDWYVNQDSRFIALKKENGGLSDARNYAIPYVKGKYIFFLDSDDSLKPEALEKLFNKAENTESDLVFCGYNEVSCNGISPVTIHCNENISGNLKDYPEILNELPHCAWNKLYRSELFTEKGIRFPKGLYYEDSGTSPIIYLESNKISVISDALVDYLIDRPGNITQSVNHKIIDVLDNLKRVNEYYQNKNQFDYFKDELCLFNLRLIYDNLWKLKMVEDQQFIDLFFYQAFEHLNNTFPQWKKSRYFQGKGIKMHMINFIKKEPKLYKRYLNR